MTASEMVPDEEVEEFIRYRREHPVPPPLFETIDRLTASTKTRWYRRLWYWLLSKFGYTYYDTWALERE